MAFFRKSWRCALFLAIASCVAGPADAWHGPISHGHVGYGHVGYGHVGHRHVGHGHHGWGWGGGYGWGGYGNLGYPSISFYRPSFGFGFAPYRSYYSSYSSFFPSYRVGYSAYYPTYRASYCAPASWFGCYVPRRVVTYSFSLPTCFAVAPVDYYPTYSYPTYNVSSLYTYPLCATGESSPDAAFQALSSARSAASPTWSASDSVLTRLAAAYPNNSIYRVNAMGDSGGGARTLERATTAERSATMEATMERPGREKLVSTGSVVGQAMVVPPELLAAADAIFSAGGFRDAAQAYARLSVRYGVDDVLSTRRFVALVACGDCEQAAVVTESSAAANLFFDATHLPGGQLTTLYGSQAAKIAEHGDLLAKYALSHADQALPLSMVGTWLTLNGQSDRARLFFDRAAQIGDDPEIASRPHLASTRVTQ